MITFIIIVIIVIVIVKLSKPNKQNGLQNRDVVERLPSFSIQGKNPSKIEQMAELIQSEHVILSFTFSNGRVSVRFKDGGSFNAALMDMSVTFMYTNHRRLACMKANGQEKWIQEAKGFLSDAEWNRIFYLLTKAGETYNAKEISKKSREEQDGMERAYKINRFLNG